MRGSGARVLSLVWLMLFLPVPGSAYSLLVSWTANTESDLAGYKLHYGTRSGTYGTTVTFGKVTGCKLSNVPAGKTYYLALTAYDSSGNESEPSREVSAYVPASATAGSITLVSPARGAVLSSRPVFSWRGSGFASYKLYASPGNSRYTRLYRGTSTSFSMSPVFWGLFIPSGTTVYWYVTGTTTGGRTVASSVSRFSKK